MIRYVRYPVVAGILVIAAVGPLAGQQTRQQRVQPGAQRPGQPEELLDRFSLRVAEALRLNETQSRRLNEELQVSRVARERVAEQRRAIRQQLNQLVRDPSSDQQRVDRLLDEFLRLQVRDAELSLGEQVRLAEFLTPLQRARLLYLRQRLAQQALQRRGRIDQPPGRGLQQRDPNL